MPTTPGTVLSFGTWLASLALVLAGSMLISAEPAIPVVSPHLAEKQDRLARRFDDLEALLLKMAQVEAKQNPRRAKLLLQAVELSRDKEAQTQLKTIADLLGNKQYSRALRGQSEVEAVLADLLKLLQSEDRSSERKSEQERLREYIREVDRLIRLQRSLQGQTEGDSDPQALAKEQAKLSDRAGSLSDRIREQEENRDEKSPAADPSASEKQKDQDKDEKSAPPENEKPTPEKNSKPAEDKDGSEKKDGTENKDASKNKDASDNAPPGEKSSSKPGQNDDDMPPMASPGKPSSSGESPQSKPNPVRQKIDSARQRMQAAQERLQEAKNKESVEQQQQARAELEQARAELERILRQLREEEMESALTALESRFRQMLESQQRIYEATRRLDAIPSVDRTPEHDVQAGKLAGDETKLVFEGEKALQLLEEEGSSVAFPATLEQTVDDMQNVARRLSQARVDTFTQGLEQDIIASLEEFLAALQQAREELEQKKQEQQQNSEGQSQSPPDQPLVNKIQELKLIRSLQLRVNSRTDRYAKMLAKPDDLIGQADSRELLEALDKLGLREQEVFEIMRKLLMEKDGN